MFFFLLNFFHSSAYFFFSFFPLTFISSFSLSFDFIPLLFSHSKLSFGERIPTDWLDFLFSLLSFYSSSFSYRFIGNPVDLLDF